jgi:hypothetical protein
MPPLYKSFKQINIEFSKFNPEVELQDWKRKRPNFLFVTLGYSPMAVAFLKINNAPARTGEDTGVPEMDSMTECARSALLSRFQRNGHAFNVDLVTTAGSIKQHTVLFTPHIRS